MGELNFYIDFLLEKLKISEQNVINAEGGNLCNCPCFLKNQKSYKSPFVGELNFYIDFLLEKLKISEQNVINGINSLYHRHMGNAINSL